MLRTAWWETGSPCPQLPPDALIMWEKPCVSSAPSVSYTQLSRSWLLTLPWARVIIFVVTLELRM